MAESVKQSPLRSILRLLRLIVVFRRPSDHVDIAKQQNFFMLTGKEKSRTPADLTVELLERICNNPRLQRSQRKEIGQAVRIIRSGTLYDVSLDVGEEGGGQAEDREWAKTGIENAGAQGAAGPANTHLDIPVEGTKLLLGEVDDLVKVYMGPAAKDADFVKKFVEGMKDWTFNMLAFQREVQGKALPAVFLYLCQSNDYVDKFASSVIHLENLLAKINNGYQAKNPFHNAAHAADVVLTCFWCLHTGQASRICNLSALDCFSVIFAAMIHDVDHPGNTNPFQIANRNALAIMYNDKSVLENHHCSFAYQTMQQDESCNILSSMPKKDKENMRAMVISMVLSTDVAKHFHEYGLLKARLQDQKFPDREKPSDKELILKCLLHACDIGNPSKSIDVTVDWTALVMTEFFAQGDEEKNRGRPISMFMDRSTTNIATCQVGFIDALVLPLYKGLEMVFPLLQSAVANLESNRVFWADHVDLFAERIKDDNPFPPDKLRSLVDSNMMGDAAIDVSEDNLMKGEAEAAKG
jgi:hypothetical protein